MENLPSNAGTLSSRDWLRGLLVAVGTAVLTAVGASVTAGHIPTGAEIKTVLSVAAIAGVSAGITYILKNLGTNDVPVAQKIVADARQKQRQL